MNITVENFLRLDSYVDNVEIRNYATGELIAEGDTSDDFIGSVADDILDAYVKRFYIEADDGFVILIIAIE